MTPLLVKLGGIEFRLFRSRILSVETVRDMPRADVFQAYRSITGDQRLAAWLDPEAVTQVVQAWVDRAHFVRVQKKIPPDTIKRVLVQNIERARDLDARNIVAPRKRPKTRPQIAIALEALKAGLGTEQVIEAIRREHPTSKANRLTVANYRRQLRDAGKLPQFQARGRRR